jgi:hypothetical protein
VHLGEVSGIKLQEESKPHAEEENRLQCEIAQIGLFKTCLESVKFPTVGNHKFNVSAQFLIIDPIFVSQDVIL